MLATVICASKVSELLKILGYFKIPKFWFCYSLKTWLICNLNKVLEWISRLILQYDWLPGQGKYNPMSIELEKTDN